MSKCQLANRLRAGKHAGRRRVLDSDRSVGGFLTKKKLKSRSKYYKFWFLDKFYCDRLFKHKKTPHSKNAGSIVLLG